MGAQWVNPMEPGAYETIYDLPAMNKASNNGVKFHLHDEQTNHYLLVDSTTLLLRVVTSEEFEASKQEQMIWFTACNDFSSTSTNPNVMTVLKFPGY